MEENRVAKTMRLVAGIVYGVLAIYQMFAATFVFSYQAVTNLSIAMLYMGALIPAAGAMAVWLLAGKSAVPEKVRRGLVVATFLVICFELVTYTDQTGVINYTFQIWLPSVATSPIMQYVGIALRLLLMILGAFFVSGARPEKVQNTVVDEVEAEAGDVVVEITETTVEVLVQPDDDEVPAEADGEKAE